MAEETADEQSLIPALTAILTAAAAYAASKRMVSGTVEAVDTALGLSAAVGGVLANIALKAITAALRGLDKETRGVLYEHVDEAVERAVDDALGVLARSLSAAIGKQQQLLGGNARGKTSPAGAPFKELDVPGSSDDPKALARRAAQTASNSAVHNIAGFSPVLLRKTWHSRKDARVRATHAFLGSKSYEYHTVNLGEHFVTIEGNRLMFPGDPTAPISETASCRCWLRVHR